MPEVDAAASAPPRLAKKILLLVPEIFSGEGGIARILQNYFSALQEISGSAAAVRCLSLNDHRERSTNAGPAGPGDGKTFAGCGRSKLRFVLQAIALARDCDVLICGHVAQLPVAWLARKIRPQLRYYLIAHGIEVWRPFGFLERLALRGTRQIFCVSAFTRGKIRAQIALADSQFAVLPNSLDRSFQIKSGTPLVQTRATILTVSRLAHSDRYKGIDNLIDALAGVRKRIPDARLRIVGRGDDSARLQNLAKKIGLGDAVVFLGFIDDEQLSQEYASCRLFALPSTGEGFGLVYIEAMARGRPCLGANVAGAKEVITKDSGMLINPDNPASLVEGLIASLQRYWDEEKILENAARFSYPIFRESLRRLLAAEPA